LGTLEDKVTRLQALATEIAPLVDADRDLVRSAATLAKADLTTGMVGEFPELQGIMGRYYALEEGERAEVAEAIAEHYAPQGPDDFCPEKPVSVAVSLADKIDTLVGFFAIGETPTGSRDPYALRRAALGVIRMVLEGGLRLPLAEIFAQARGFYGARAGDGDVAETVAALLDFFADRLKVHLRGRGMGHDLISAVFAVRKSDGAVEDDLVRLVARAEALKKFLETEDGTNLLAAHKRASNIVAIEEKKDKVTYADDAVEDLLTQDEEKALFGRLHELGKSVRPAIDGERFDEAMGLLAELRAPVDAFFDQVTVNCNEVDLRVNRLRLLSKIRGVMGEIADFACIEG
ncbi:MAG: glycine--tRNA ligase subunit beta, partial [Alphaproteobacteria bacterium]